MGTWGYKLYDNDLFGDVKGDYDTYLHRGKTPQEAVQLLCRDFIPNGDEEEPSFWVCVADLQWHYGHLDPEIKAKALDRLCRSGQTKGVGRRASEKTGIPTAASKKIFTISGQENEVESGRSLFISDL